MNRIRQLRLGKQWRQIDLAQILNTTQQTIGRYENENTGLDAVTIQKLCELFCVTSDYLLGFSASPSPVISDDDAALLQAYHEAPPSVAAAIRTLLEPYASKNAQKAV